MDEEKYQLAANLIADTMPGDYLTPDLRQQVADATLDEILKILGINLNVD